MIGGKNKTVFLVAWLRSFGREDTFVSTVCWLIFSRNTVQTAQTVFPLQIFVDKSRNISYMGISGGPMMCLPLNGFCCIILC